MAFTTPNESPRFTGRSQCSDPPRKPGAVLYDQAISCLKSVVSLHAVGRSLSQSEVQMLTRAFTCGGKVKPQRRLHGDTEPAPLLQPAVVTLSASPERPTSNFTSLPPSVCDIQTLSLTRLSLHITHILDLCHPPPPPPDLSSTRFFALRFGEDTLISGPTCSGGLHLLRKSPRDLYLPQGVNGKQRNIQQNLQTQRSPQRSPNLDHGTHGHLLLH